MMNDEKRTVRINIIEFLKSSEGKKEVDYDT